MSNFYYDWWDNDKFSFILIHLLFLVAISLMVWVHLYPITPHIYTLQEKIHLCVTQEEPHFVIVEAYDPIVKGDCIDVVNSYLGNGSKIADTTIDRRGDIYSYVLEK